MSLPASPARGPRHIPPERRHYHILLFKQRKCRALTTLAVGLSPFRHGRACPGYPRGQRFKAGPTWGGPQQSFAGTKLSPLPRSRTFDAPNHVDSRDKPGHDALKLVRRSPHNPDSDDQQLTRQEPNAEMPCATGPSRFFARAPELSQRLGCCRRSALEVRPEPSGLDARLEAPARANTSEVTCAFRRDSVENRQ